MHHQEVVLKVPEALAAAPNLLQAVPVQNLVDGVPEALAVVHLQVQVVLIKIHQQAAVVGLEIITAAAPAAIQSVLIFRYLYQYQSPLDIQAMVITTVEDLFSLHYLT